MKKAVIVLILFVLISSVLFSQSKKFGLGIIIGEPTGFTGKLWLSKFNSLNAAIAWSILHEENFYIHLDHVFHYYKFFNFEEGELPVHIGLGGRLLLRKGQEGNIGMRIPLGITYIFRDIPIEIFGEIVPVVNLIPETDMDVDGGIGFRYFF